ncbi:MAG: methionine--tRNA ligase [Candidatus Micrarchaeota archaeon]
MEKPRILITSALPYVNNVPHLGNLIGCVLSADVFARYNRLRGRKVLYVCGTDEYGTATEAKALEEGVSPKELCGKYHEIHKRVYEWFNISFDAFGRTTDEKHTGLVQKIFLDLHKNGFTVEKEIEQAYDEKLGMFLADRFILGECPFCGSLEARADQCDKCGKLLTFSELKNARSKLSGEVPVLRKSRHILIDLPKIQPRLEEWIADIEKSGRWSANTIAIAKAWLAQGLECRSITRDLKWGVPVPLPGWEKKVFYVWFDAPIGYISITAGQLEDYMKWWGGGDVKHYEFIGKDNVPFHAIIFPATLFGSGGKWTLPHYISSTEFLNYEGGKFSKSRGIGVFGTDAIDSGIPADVWRYYLVANRPETSDADFSWDDFGAKANNELLSNFGNLVNRTLVFLEKNFEGVVPAAKLRHDDEEFLEGQKVRIAKAADLLDGVKLRAAIHEMMGFCSDANKYFQDNEPWKEIKGDRERAGTVMNVLANQVLDLAIICRPFLPASSDAIYGQLNTGKMQWDQAGKMGLKSGHKLGAPAHLFEPVEEKTLEGLRAKFAGKKKSGAGERGLSGDGKGKSAGIKEEKNNDGKKAEGEDRTKAGSESSGDDKTDVKKLELGDLELEVGLIESVEKHPNADKLFIERIAMRDGEVRQVCSGLVGHVSEEELLGKTCIIVKNLKPAKLRGVESAGMLLAAQGKGGLEVVSPEAVAGTAVEFEGVERAGKFREITIGEFFTVKMRAEGGIVFADGKRILAGGKEVRVEKVKEGEVR